MELVELGHALLVFLREAGPTGALWIIVFLYGLLRKDRWWVTATEHNMVVARADELDAENKILRTRMDRIVALNERTISVAERTVPRESSS